jgi:hypothetical protein
MFGATLASDPHREDSVFKKIRERAGQWRRTNVLVAWLRQISPAAALPLDENFLQALIERLNLLFTGTISTDDTELEECFKDLLEKGAVLRKILSSGVASTCICPFTPVLSWAGNTSSQSCNPSLKL